jgi:hypothetical protein
MPHIQPKHSRIQVTLRPPPPPPSPLFLRLACYITAPTALLQPHLHLHLSLRIAHDLVICGFGGSCPATRDAREVNNRNKSEPKHNRNITKTARLHVRRTSSFRLLCQCWTGVPFASQSTFTAAFAEGVCAPCRFVYCCLRMRNMTRRTRSCSVLGAGCAAGGQRAARHARGPYLQQHMYEAHCSRHTFILLLFPL